MPNALKPYRLVLLAVLLPEAGRFSRPQHWPPMARLPVMTMLRTARRRPQRRLPSCNREISSQRKIGGAASP